MNEMEEAIRLYYQGDILRAERILKRLVESEPENINACIRLAEIEKELDKLEEAEEVNLKIAAIYEKNGGYEDCLDILDRIKPQFLLDIFLPLRGRCLFHLGRYSEALSDFLQSPWDSQTKFYEGKCYFYLGNYDDALKTFKEIFSETSSREELYLSHYWIGKSLYGQGNIEDAIACFNSYIPSYPKEKQVYLDLAICYLNIRNFDKAKKSLAKYRRLGGSTDVVYFYTGLICYNQEDYMGAIANLDKTSLDDQSLHWKGMAFYQLARYEEALESFSQASKSQAKPLYLKMMGNANLKMGNFFEAKFCYEKALDLDPSDEDIKRLIYVTESLL
ncbi:tetratricopeptide repeat protein [Pelotomaculum propionicicum]|uniref:tetratricopeptide repeat protein n=1 Tax=Pelotomaculum propionicicum TaxID=258475 RepID=UPI003B7CC4DD